jgi:hypothetical protein
MAEKFEVPSELIELPSQGKLYPKENPLSSGSVEMKYMTAKEEDIITNVNLLRQGIAIEKMLKSLIKSPINYEDLTIGDRNALLIASRILAYGKDYSFTYDNSSTGEREEVTVDLQNLSHKKVNLELFENDNEVEFLLPNSKRTVTFKILTVADDRKIDEEVKALKKTLGQDSVGYLSTRLKFQITSVDGDRSMKAINDFIDRGQLLAIDARELRKFMTSVTPDVDMSVSFTTKTGEEVTMDLPMTADFFFPGN